MKRKSARPSFSRRPSFNKREKTDKGGRIRQRNSVGITGASFASGCDRSGYSDGKERTEAGGKCRDIPGNE